MSGGKCYNALHLGEGTLLCDRDMDGWRSSSKTDLTHQLMVIFQDPLNLQSLSLSLLINEEIQQTPGSDPFPSHRLPKRKKKKTPTPPPLCAAGERTQESWRSAAFYITTADISIADSLSKEKEKGGEEYHFSGLIGGNYFPSVIGRGGKRVEWGAGDLEACARPMHGGTVCSAWEDSRDMAT